MSKMHGRLSVGSVVSVIGLMALLVLTDAWGQTPRRGDKALLRLVAGENKANRSALRTWQGKVTFKTSTAQALPQVKKQRAGQTRTITYAWDGAARRYSFLTNEPWEGAGDKPAFPFTQLRWGAIRTPEGYFHVTPWKGEDKKDGKRKRPITIFDRPTLQIGPPSAESRDDFSPDFDPILYMDVMREDAYPWLMGLHDNWERYKHYELGVIRAGEQVTVTIRQAKVLDQRYIFDLGKGGNLVSNHNQDDLVEAKRSREFNKISDVWVPVSARTEMRNLSSGVVDLAEVTWFENKVNQPVPPSAFALASLGLKPGDEVNDKRIRTRSKFDANSDVTAPAAWDWTLILLLSAAACAVLVLLLGWCVRRALKKKGGGDANAS